MVGDLIFDDPIQVEGVAIDGVTEGLHSKTYGVTDVLHIHSKGFGVIKVLHTQTSSLMAPSK
jgi:hypothetical protein